MGHVQQIKKAAVGMSPSPTGATGTRPSSSADPLVTGESPVCIPHTPRLWGAGPEASCGTADNLSQTLCPRLFDTHLKLFNHMCLLQSIAQPRRAIHVTPFQRHNQLCLIRSLLSKQLIFFWNPIGWADNSE